MHIMIDHCTHSIKKIINDPWHHSVWDQLHRVIYRSLIQNTTVTAITQNSTNYNYIILYSYMIFINNRHELIIISYIPHHDH